jgi:P27 family predicted phage terminase small subunit
MPGTANSGGRNKKSAQRHKLEGTFQKSRHAGAKAPEPPIGLPTPPIKLTGVALAEWKRMVARLQVCRSLSVVDDAVLFQYAKLFAETEELADDKEHASGLIDKLGDALVGLDGADMSNAIRDIVKLKQQEAGYSTKVRQGRLAIRAYLVEFGMTPAARSRVKVQEGKPEENDPFAEFDATVN